MQQLSLFDDFEKNEKQTGVEYVVKTIISSDSTRQRIKNAIKNNNKPELVKLFRQSINTFGFGHPKKYSWNLGKLEDRQNSKTYKVTEKELAEVALTIFKGVIP